MATRPRSRKAQADSKYFPISIRIRVPEEGFGSDMEAIHEWWNSRVGKGSWGLNSERVLSRSHTDAVVIHTMDPHLVAPFLQDLALELAIGDPDLCGEGSFKLINPSSIASARMARCPK